MHSEVWVHRVRKGKRFVMNHPYLDFISHSRIFGKHDGLSHGQQYFQSGLRFSCFHRLTAALPLTLAFNARSTFVNVGLKVFDTRAFDSTFTYLHMTIGSRLVHLSTFVSHLGLCPRSSRTQVGWSSQGTIDLCITLSIDPVPSQASSGPRPVC